MTEEQKATLRAMSAHQDTAEAVEARAPWYGTEDAAMLRRLHATPAAPVVAYEDQYPLDVEIELDDSQDDCMREGDVVVAVFDYSRDVVQIKFIDGDHVCVKMLDGSLKISKLEDLRHIPENF